MPYEDVKVVTPPAEEPVTVAEAKAHLKLVEFVGDEDAQQQIDSKIASLITAAREKFESWSGRSVITQTIDVWWSNYDHIGVFELPRGPVQSVVGVYTHDAQLEEHAVDEDEFPHDLLRDSIVFDVFPPFTYRQQYGYRVRAIVGYGNSTKTPRSIVEGILELVALWYGGGSGEGTTAKYEVEAKSSGDLPQQVATKWRPHRRGNW